MQKKSNIGFSKDTEIELRIVIVNWNHSALIAPVSGLLTYKTGIARPVSGSGGGIYGAWHTCRIQLRCPGIVQRSRKRRIRPGSVLRAMQSNGQSFSISAAHPMSLMYRRWETDEQSDVRYFGCHVRFVAALDGHWRSSIKNLGPKTSHQSPSGAISL
jgi:hypothetical protein